MTEKKIEKQDIDELFKVLLKLKTVKDFENLFADLCTNKEIEQMASRIKAAKMLIDGKTYNQVKRLTFDRVVYCVKEVIRI